MTITLPKQLNTGSVTLSAAALSVSAASSVHLDAEAYGASNDQEMEIAFPFANIKAYWLLSTTACTIETNSGSAADDTISLAAGVPKIFFLNGGTADSEFTADVTSIFVSAAAAGTLTLFVAYDPTP
jgi:hypothetical protein